MANLDLEIEADALCMPVALPDALCMPASTDEDEEAPPYDLL